MEALLTLGNLEKYGVGLVAVGLLFALLIYYIKTIKPTLEALVSTNSLITNSLENNTKTICTISKDNNEAINNNSRAITEVSRSNDNVANAIKLLDSTLKRVEDKMDTQEVNRAKNEEKLDRINTEIVKISIRTENM